MAFPREHFVSAHTAKWPERAYVCLGSHRILVARGESRSPHGIIGTFQCSDAEGSADTSLELQLLYKLYFYLSPQILLLLFPAGG